MSKIKVTIELGCSSPKSFFMTEEEIRTYGVGSEINLPTKLEVDKSYDVGTSSPHRFPSDVRLEVLA